MALNLVAPEEHELRARITVFGVGGAGGNAVNNMIEKQLEGVDFIAANTDAQALGNTKAARALQLGTGVTRGLGAGSKPEVGMRAAEETIEDVAAHLDGCHMCFITAGMGGGTGTGAAPIVAKVAREMGILTVGVVTKPFHFEGQRRMAVADAGIEEMQGVVDTLIVIPNQNLFQVASERTTFVEAFQMADDVLYQGVQGVTDLMVRPGMINLDFADVRSVMEEMGKAMMGTGEAEGETRAIDAAEKAIANPLLDEVSLKGAKGVLINITGGYDLTLFEMDEAANRIKEEVDAHAMIKFGSAIDPGLEGKMRVSVVATGIDAESVRAAPPATQTTRRKPAETDPAIVAAIRGRNGGDAAIVATASMEAAASHEAPDASSAVVASSQSETQEEGSIQDHAAETREDLPDTAASTTREDRSATDAAPQPDVEIRAERQPQASPETSPDARYATAPSPRDIRARAEEVRQRALAARARKDQERVEPRNPIAAEDPALFDLDDRSIDHRPLSQPERIVDPVAASRDNDGSADGNRSGLFTINKLIHRVAGGSSADERSAPAQRTDPEVPAMDDDAGDIPAFLRRQAN
ncbi:MAG: cell division protein FtsZ [Pseudomonadota bacterium]